MGSLSNQYEQDNTQSRQWVDNQVLVGGEDIVAQRVHPRLPASGGQQRVDTLNERATEQARIRIGTLLKSDNVSFLLGAGSSMEAGGVSLASIPYQIEKELLKQGFKKRCPSPSLSLFYKVVGILTHRPVDDPQARRKRIRAMETTMDLGGGDSKTVRGAVTAFEIPLNLEGLLSYLHIWQAAMLDGSTLSVAIPDGEALEVKRDDLQTLVSLVTEALLCACELPLPGREKALDAHRSMIKKILTRPLNLRRVNLFTLNYDTLLEQASDAEGVVMIDGFVGTLQRAFRPESFDQDLYFPAQTTEGRVHRLDRVVHLYKLHGSIEWHQENPRWENPYGLCANWHERRGNHGNVVIYPSCLKYGVTLGMPYAELFRRFATAIAQPQSVLFAVGYGFGDQHVNNLITQALAIPSFTLVVVDPSPRSQYVQRLEELRDQRVWVIKGPIGQFSRFVDYVLPNLHQQEILQKVAATYLALHPTGQYQEGEGGAAGGERL